MDPRQADPPPDAEQETPPSPPARDDFPPGSLVAVAVDSRSAAAAIDAARAAGGPDAYLLSPAAVLGQDARRRDDQGVLGALYQALGSLVSDQRAIQDRYLEHAQAGRPMVVVSARDEATAERLWEAITDPATRAKYHFGAVIESEWTPGSRFELNHPGADGPLAEGENLVVEPPHRLVQTMHMLWSEEADNAGTSRVTWEIEPVGDSCRLTVTHDQLSDTAPPELYGGWPMILSGLKTWLETGQTLTTPGSLMYGEH